MFQGYPAATTGTSEDLMSIIIRASELEMARSGEILPGKFETARPWLEPPLILAGILASGLMELAPSEWVLRFHDGVFSALASPRRYPFDSSSPALARAGELLRRLEAESGRRPALLALISHAPVTGEMAHFNFELVRHAMLALRALRGRPCRPRLVVAVDPFALDTIPLYQEGLYAGCMGHYHMGLDRMFLGRGLLSRFLLRWASWDRMPWRLLRELGSGRELGMVLAGGVPGTARALYALREWVGRQRRSSPWRSRPSEILRRLRGFPDYARFEAEGPHGPGLRGRPWRMIEAWAMSAVTGAFTRQDGTEESCARSGRLTGEARSVLGRCLEALGLDPARREAAMESLSDELSRETPYRARFLEILAGRCLKKGRPLVLLPVVHRVEGPGIELREAWAWKELSGGRLRARSAAQAADTDWEGTVEEFAVCFGKANFA